VDRPFPYRNLKPAAKPLSARHRALAQWRRWDWSSEEKARQPSAQPAADVMPRVLAGLHIDTRQSETEILKVWSNQIDPNVTAHAQPTGIRRGTLFVTVDSSVWLSEIVRYRRHEILERLQNSFGRDLITKISFRVG
jgi:predicted nucleic acid-binding Zn ribbon protein